MKDVELNEVDQEKQPINTAENNGDAVSPTEKNGSIHLKIPEETQSKFTGLSKDELLRVAGTPGWVRTRWTLLILFWLGWLGMLAGAVAIIVQAPRCKELPEMNWWNYGPLYQVGDVKAFTDSENLKGVEEKLDSISQLKVKGLVVGPIHVAPADDPLKLNFEEVSLEAGTLEQVKGLVAAARKKSISVVLDLTPNYLGSSPWFSNDSITTVAERLKSALMFWMDKGVDGFQFSGVDRVATAVPVLWDDIRKIVQKRDTEAEKKKLLIGVTDVSSPADVSNLLNVTGVDLLVSGVLGSTALTATGRAEAVEQLYSANKQQQLAWNIGGRTEGHLASLVPAGLVHLNQMLLFTLPGTPVFNYGDEIGLKDEDSKFPKMLWVSPEESAKLNGTEKEEMDQQLSTRNFFKTMSDLRGKERSLQHGDYTLLFNSTSALAYLRLWDQSERYVAAFNWGEEAVTLRLAHADLPVQAVVKATGGSAPKLGSTVSLTALEIGAGQAVLLSFPYTG